MDVYKNDARVVQAIVAGDAAAKRFAATGFRGLSTRQKRRVRALLNLPYTGAVTVRTQKVTPQTAAVMRAVGGKARSNGRRVTVSRAQLLTDVYRDVTSDGKITSWVVDPRSSVTFRDLYADAARYQKYIVNRLAIRFSSKCSNFTNGGVVLAFMPDASDPDPETKEDILRNECKVDAAAKAGVLLTCPTDSKVRLLRDSASDDAKLVDYGKFVVCVYGQSESDPAILGELFLEYTITLIDPQPNQSLTQHTTYTNSSPVGPNYATFVASAKSVTLTFLSLGRFHVCLFFAVKTVGDAAAHNISLDDLTTVSGESDHMYSLVVRVTRTGGTFQIPVDAVPTSTLWYVSPL